jgi:hypothetical protein
MPNCDPIDRRAGVVARRTPRSVAPISSIGDIYYTTQSQIRLPSVCGTMMRDRPATNFFIGRYAEASFLRRPETRQAQSVAGTDSDSRLPFFICACDYTLIGEAVRRACISRASLCSSGLSGQDVAKR